MATVGGASAHWIRCRVDPFTRAPTSAAAYTLPPEIYSIRAGALGARIPAMHATRRRAELLGESDGTPGQTFRCATRPALALPGDETLEVLPPRAETWERWELQRASPRAAARIAHLLVDAAAGEVHLGTAVNAGDGAWRQYGRVPPKGRSCACLGYRNGGGRRGNLAAGMLSVLKSSIPGVAAVTNPVPAIGGVDGETLETPAARAPLELRTRYRAVTADDFEALCAEGVAPGRAGSSSRPTRTEGVTRVQLLPMVEDPPATWSRHELHAERGAAERGRRPPRRRGGWSAPAFSVAPVPLRGVTVVCDVQAAPRSDLGRVERDIERMLYTYLNPLVGGSANGGPPAGSSAASLNQGEVYGIVHPCAGVEFVKILRVYETNLETGQAGGEAGRLAPRARARRADRLGHACRQGRPPGGRLDQVGRGNDPPHIAERASRAPRPSTGGIRPGLPALGHLPSIYQQPRPGRPGWALGIDFVAASSRCSTRWSASLDCLPRTSIPTRRPRRC